MVSRVHQEPFHKVVFTIKSQPHHPATDASILSGGGKAVAAGTPASHTTASVHLKSAGNLQIQTTHLHDLPSSQKQSPEVPLTWHLVCAMEASP